MTFPNASVAMASTILDEFARHGIRHIVIAPGSRSAALTMTALAMGFDVDVHLDERSAGFFALGLGRVGKVVPVVTTSGTAVANLVPAVAEADLSNTPLLVVSADRPPELRERGANQTMDQLGIFGSRTRWEFDPGVAEDESDQPRLWRSMVSRAVASALGGLGLPGPVHLNLPFREPLVPDSDDGRVVTPPFHSETKGRADGATWGEVRIPDPVRITRDEAPSRTLVLIGDTGVPVDIDLEGVAFVAEPHAGHRSADALTGLHYLATHPSAAGLMPERVITVGRVGLSRPLSTWLADVETTVIDPTGRWVEHTEHEARVGSVSVPPASEEWIAALRAADDVVHAAVSAEIDSWTELSEPRIARDTARAVRTANARMVVASSMPIRDLDLVADTAPLHVHANRGVSGIDGFVSTTLGVARGSDHPVIALAGDLSMLHDSNGFLMADRPDCVFVVINNDGGGIFSFLPQAHYPESFERLFGTPHGRSFRGLAEFHSLDYSLVDDASQIEALIEAAVAIPGPVIIEAVTDRAMNIVHHSRLTDAAHEALDDL